jgi:methanogenic corrinoid protein MtbC1
MEEGIIAGIRSVGKKFEEKEYFLPELITGGEIVTRCLDLVTPEIPKERLRERRRIVIGTVKGDIHSIGKNLVALMLEASGQFEVFNLGIDISAMTFIDRAEEVRADIIGLSTLMSSCLEMPKETIRGLVDLGIRDRFKVMVGGGATTAEFAKSIGADAWAADATEAVKVAQNLVG